MIPLNLHHLYYFWTVAREGSIARASQRLYLSPTAVSAQLIQLEKFFKCRLFERAASGLTLTEEGRIALEYAQDIFTHADSLLEAMRQPRLPRVRQIVIGIEHRVSNQVSHRALAAVRRHHPGTRSLVYQGSLPHLLAELRIHAIDAVLSTLEPPASGSEEWMQVPIGALPVHFVASADVARRIRRFPADLTRAPLLMPVHASAMRESIRFFLEQHDLRPVVIEELEDVDLLRLRALHGAGVAPISEVVVREDLRSGALVRLNRTPTGLTNPIWLIAGRRRHPHPVVASLLKAFRLRRPRA